MIGKTADEVFPEVEAKGLKRATTLLQSGRQLFDEREI